MNPHARDTYVPSALLLCGEGSVPCAMIERTALAAGFEVVANVSRWPQALQALADTAIDVVIVDLALTGSLGVRIVAVLQAVVPSCEVVVISPLEGIDPHLRRAGALAVVSPSDLRPLLQALRTLALLRSHPARRTHTTTDQPAASG